MQQTDRDRRNAILDELEEALDDWYEKATKEIDDEEAFLKSVLKGRTGSERLATATTSAAQILVIDDLGSFLAGT